MIYNSTTLRARKKNSYSVAFILINYNKASVFFIVAIDVLHHIKVQTIRKFIRIGATNLKNTNLRWNPGKRNKWYVANWINKFCSLSMETLFCFLVLHLILYPKYADYILVSLHPVIRKSFSNPQQCSARQNYSNQHPNDIISGTGDVWPVGKLSRI